MDLNILLRRHQLSLMNADSSLTSSNKRRHDQFAQDYAEQIGLRRSDGRPDVVTWISHVRNSGPPGSAKPARRGGQTQSFRKYGEVARLTAQQAGRQNDVLQSAWRHFGVSGPAIAFLNTQHPALEAQPLHLALQSEEGLLRVERLLEGMTLSS